jgi:hypothetical protein
MLGFGVALAAEERYFMLGWNSPITSPYLFLALGGVALSAGAIWTCTGKAWIRFHGWVYHAQEPKRFWSEVAMDFLIGVVFIGLFLHLTT